MSATTLLPTATSAEVATEAVRLLRRHRGAVLLALLLHAAAVAAGLVGPRVLGEIVDGVRTEITTARVDRLALVFAAALVVQAVLTRWARLRSALIGETVLAELREDFLAGAVALPLGTVERAGSGDLVTRATTDIDRLSYAVREAAPEITVATLTSVLIMAAAFLTAPLVAVAMLVGAPPIILGTRWYRRRADEGYRREMAAVGRVTAGVVETADAGRSVEALGLQDRRVERTERDIRDWIAAERYTLWLRTVWFPTAEIGYVLPIVFVVFAGGTLVARGSATVGEVTAVALYVQMLIEPVDLVVSWLDELQIGNASLARLLGVRLVEPAPVSDEVPTSDDLHADDVRFAYREGHDVLHGITLDVRPGSRLAIVGPSGAGKSTLGRLLAGIHPPRTGSVTVGGAEVSRLPADVLREQVALVTQEHHVFVGTIRDNVALARPGALTPDIEEALAAVDALDWVKALPDGLETRVGSGAHVLAPAEAQQVALARLVLADPHTLVLDEATSMLDPRAARHLERSLAAVLRNRTVIAIAHRLHTAHDADRVAVVAEGGITEIGSHDELLAADGAYAALWRSWRA
ncbi:MAG TPA: ABC transporter ATP-binding protein [Mycobacteriales bacterium]|nr:ABC transporter ATP-binding protein [Mycobacteriales bacterium]